MPENTINLDEITDITTLKALKSDQYERISLAEQTIQEASNNLRNLNIRIAQLMMPEPAEDFANGTTEQTGKPESNAEETTSDEPKGAQTKPDSREGRADADAKQPGKATE